MPSWIQGGCVPRRSVECISLAVQRDAIGSAIVHVQLQVEEPGIACVEDAQAVTPGFHGYFRIDRAVG